MARIRIPAHFAREENLGTSGEEARNPTYGIRQEQNSPLAILFPPSTRKTSPFLPFPANRRERCKNRERNWERKSVDEKIFFEENWSSGSQIPIDVVPCLQRSTTTSLLQSGAPPSDEEKRVETLSRTKIFHAFLRRCFSFPPLAFPLYSGG